MKRLAAAIVLAAVSAGLTVNPAWTAIPKPAPVPLNWQLDVVLQTPKALRVQLPDDKAGRVYWYLVYTVTNHTGSDQIFVPEFTLYTDTGQVLRAGQVPAGVFEVIKKTVNDPLLRDTIGMAGKLLQGDDNGKTGVAIWPDFDPKAGAFDVFVGGLSGESVEITLPSPVEVAQRDFSGNVKTVTKDKMVLSKTLQARYTVPGEADARLMAQTSLVSKEWVMR